MRRFKGFGVRRSFEKAAASDTLSGPQCFPQFYSPARESHRRRSVDGRVADLREPAPGEGAGAAMRRRSVDDSRAGESVDLRAVRKEWKPNSSSAVVSSSDSFSSSQSSSRPSDASAVSSDTIRDAIRDHSSGAGAPRVVVVGFDSNAKESGVGATVMWAFRNTGMQRGDVLVMVGVMDTVRGPLGYKVQVNDQTWLGASKKFLEEEIKAKNLAWAQEFPMLRKRCADAGVKLLVDVRASPRPEVAIVAAATARGAAHVVLDKSLLNKRRRYYLERLACDVTRMRRSGGEDTIRSRDRIPDKPIPPSSPTSVLPHRPPPAPEPRKSFNSNLSHLVKLVEEKNANTTSGTHSTRRPSSNPTIDEEELFCIDHDFLSRRVEMLLEPEPDLADHRRHDQLIVDEGYESDDLFSLAGDGASRRPSLAVFAMESARNSMRSSLSRVSHLAAG